MIHTPLKKLPEISATQAQQFYPKFQKLPRKNAFSKLMISSNGAISAMACDRMWKTNIQLNALPHE